MTAQAGGRFEIGRALNNTFSVVGRNIGLWAGLAIIFSAIPGLVFQFALLGLSGSGLSNPEAAFTDPNVMAAAPWVSGLSALVSLILGLLLTSALARGTIEDLSGKRPAMGDCISTAVSLLLPAIGIAVVIGLVMFVIALVAIFIIFGMAAAVSSPGMTALLSFLVLIPIVMLFLRWSVAVPALVQERAGVLGSMARSAALTKGSRWALLGLFVIVGIIAIVVNLVLGLIIYMFGTLIGVVLGVIVQSLVSTLFSTASAVSYVELRQVKEGTSVGELAEIFS